MRDCSTLQDEGVPIDAIADAAILVIEALDEAQRAATCLHLDSPEWRTWSNPEILLSDKGILSQMKSARTFGLGVENAAVNSVTGGGIR